MRHKSRIEKDYSTFFSVKNKNLTKLLKWTLKNIIKLCKISQKFCQIKIDWTCFILKNKYTL